MAQQPMTARGGRTMPPVTSISERPVRLHLPRLSHAVMRWSPAFNVAMVLVLLVALTAGMVGFFNHDSGPGEVTRPAQLAAIASPEVATPTPMPTETPVPTKAPQELVRASMPPLDTFGGALPTPDECTVKPLTIDEVMARLGYEPRTPEEQEATRDAAATQIAEFDPDAGLPGPGTPFPESTYTPPVVPQREPTQQEMDAIVAAHRQLIACIMKGTPLQIWAMIDPENRYWKEVAQFAIPAFTDPAIVRMKIEGFVAGKQWLFPDPTQMIPTLWSETPMVNPDPSTATITTSPEYLDGSPVATVSMLYYSQRDPASSPYTTTQWASSYGRSEHDGWSYRYNPELKQWLLLYHEGNFSQQG